MPRTEHPGALYHAIIRGYQNQRPYKDPADLQKYLLTLTAYQNRSGSRVFACVLTSDHVPLLIETQAIPISKVMQGLNQTSTIYFNRRYRTGGHVFPLRAGEGNSHRG